MYLVNFKGSRSMCTYTTETQAKHRGSERPAKKTGISLHLDDL